MADPTRLANFEFRLTTPAELTTSEREVVHAIFAENYRQPNHKYLDKSLGTLGFICIATTKDGEPAGFGLGDSRILDLPRLPGQSVSLGGICCVSQTFRRQGVFGELERRAIGARGLPPAERVLSCGRMAHPASFKGMASNPSVVPRRGVAPTEWQQEVGQFIADVYGSPGFDPVHFVCKGTGEPIGYPIIEIEATPAEWEPFAHVNRDKGDSLLGISWRPTSPPGW